MLKRDIVNAIADKLEATILGGDAASTTQPAGLMNGASATTVSHANIVALEQALEEANVNGEFKMIVSPAIKAKLKTTALDSGSGRFLMEGNECNGYQVLATSNCKGLVMGKFDDLVIAQWGAIDLVIDPYTQASNGAIRVVVNAYFDAKPRRTESFVAKTVAVTTSK
jgi:HK97 family phage major capsid protein